MIHARTALLLALVATPALAQQQPTTAPSSTQPASTQPVALAAPNRPVDLMRGYLELVEQYARLANDRAHAGVGAVLTAAEILRPQGADATVRYFEARLAEATDPAVRRAIRLTLADVYKQVGQPDRALAHLTAVMTEKAP